MQQHLHKGIESTNLNANLYSNFQHHCNKDDGAAWESLSFPMHMSYLPDTLQLTVYTPCTVFCIWSRDHREVKCCMYIDLQNAITNGHTKTLEWIERQQLLHVSINGEVKENVTYIYKKKVAIWFLRRSLSAYTKLKILTNPKEDRMQAMPEYIAYMQTVITWMFRKRNT